MSKQRLARIFNSTLAGCVLAVALCSSAYAQSLPPDLALVQFPNNATTFAQPVGVRNANDDSGRVFVIEKGGNIRIVKNGTVNATPFLTVPVTTGPIGNEQGLLGLAFHPQFKTNRKFYIAYTRTGGTPLGTQPDQVLAEYQASAGNPDVADVASRREILAIPDLFGNHNGGDIHFGSDGYLYYGMGDGGSANDPNDFSQNLWRKVVGGRNYYLLGKMLRLDIDNTTPNASAELCATATGQTAQYAIPPSNPMVASSNTCDEIYHYGLRNPFRFSFDRRNGDMYIGDVGQGAWEEVDLSAPNTPLNFGWRCLESAANTGLCTTLPANATPAILEYGHGTRCSITGGFNYRGPIAALQGSYFYADYCSREIWWSRRNGNSFTSQVWTTAADSPVGFGEDQLGNLYLTTLSSGAIYRISSASDNDFIFGHGSEG